VKKKHSVYVVELAPDVMELKKMQTANPGYVEGCPCVYVGSTGLLPEERFANHKRGYKGSSLVRRFGLRLLPDEYSRHNPMTYREAAAKERELAAELRGLGWAVWQH